MSVRARSTGKEVTNGKAYEYALAQQLGLAGRVSITNNPALATAKTAYGTIPNHVKTRMDKSAKNVARFLIASDQRLAGMQSVTMQGDAAGMQGDVRDIIIACGKHNIGISAKHNHDAVKHSRLSDTIDFGKEWGECPVSQQYWNAVTPVFQQMRLARAQNKKFSAIPNKAQVYYLPVLTAFEDELKQLCDDHAATFITPLFRYLIGRHDFYKVICAKKSSIIQSVNIGGSLRWGSKWKIPTRIDQIARKRGTTSTVLVTFEGGWQLSFRLHNARTMVEPSLKFDIKFIGMASNVARHEIAH